ncbi:Protein STE12 [Rhodotorula toruloides]|nr:Protein STE12 [Rhodotorula toruloides]
MSESSRRRVASLPLFCPRPLARSLDLSLARHSHLPLAMISSTASALQLFIATAPTTFPTVQDQGNVLTLRTFDLTDGETIACIRWQGLYYVTGTDVVRILDFQSRQAGLHQNDSKAFARGVYSDLRRLKIGRDCVLLPSQAPLLDALFRDDFIKTRKARKLFFWFSVPYDDLLRRVLDRHGILVSPVSSTTIVRAIA